MFAEDYARENSGPVAHETQNARQGVVEVGSSNDANRNDPIPSQSERNSGYGVDTYTASPKQEYMNRGTLWNTEKMVIKLLPAGRKLVRYVTSFQYTDRRCIDTRHYLIY